MSLAKFWPKTPECSTLVKNNCLPSPLGMIRIMSERPENPQNNPGQSGWHSPREATPWQPGEQPTPSTIGWRTMKALPDDMDTAPEKRGDWHLPQESDTIFSPADEITVSPVPTTGTSPVVIRPEDLLAEIVGQKRAQAALRPEDLVPQRRKKEDETVAADAVQEGETILVDEASTALPNVEDDDEELTMSEYIALASLAQGMDQPTNINVADLSPAERALYNVASQYASELPAETRPDTGATVTLQDTSQQTASQAADYARQQLAQLQGGTGQEPVSFTQAPTVPQYTPEQIQLAQQFRETKRQVQVLRQMQAQGQIAPQELEARLQQFTILDPQGNWWMIGLDTDQWYRYNNSNGQWDLATPPVPLDAGAVRTETGLGSVAPDVMAGSLPYLPDSAQEVSPEEFSDYDASRYSAAQQQYSQQYGIQDTPIPRPGQPVNDPNLTVVGASVDQTMLSNAAPTMQGLNYVDSQATMPSASVDYLEDEYAPISEVISQPRPIATGLEDPNLYIPSPDFEAQAERQQQSALFYVAVAGVGLIICGLLSVAMFAWYAQSQYDAIVGEWRDEIASLGSGEVDFQTARILAADGSTIAEITGEEGARTLVSIEEGQVSPFFVHAIVSSEDPRFYENPGFDVWAVGRAFLQNLTAGEVVSGASTITQQIVRERVIGSNLVTFDRKLTEVLVALEVANTYTKNQILDIYINEFFYGEQSYGVEAASQFYFGVPAADLNAAQAATLVGILPAPSSANPVVAPLESFNNMRVVLNRMLEANCIQFQHGQWAATGTPFCVNEDTVVDGAQLLILDESGEIEGGLIQVQIAQVETRRYEPRQSDILYPHFVYYVLGELDAAYGRGAYIDRGFTVYTTLNPDMQDASEEALQTAVESLSLNGAVTGATIVMEPQSGAIRAMVGSPDFYDVEAEGQNNNTLTLQQPGSAIKPVLYTAALMGGPNGYYTPATILWDVPTRFPLNDGTSYAPTNFDNRTRGPVPLRYALQQSLNIPAVKTYAFLGGEAFVTTANAMGINFDPNPDDEIVPTFGLATAIGATEVSLYDLTHAYATLANDGIYTPLYVVDRITEGTPNGNQIDVELTGNLDHSTQLQVVSPQVAYLMQNILSDDTARSTVLNDVGSSFSPNGLISGASLGLPNQNYVAAKTGTNNTESGNPSRIWTVGFTNDYAVGVWVGTLDQGTPMSGNVSGLAGAAPAWNSIMRAVQGSSNPGPFQAPPQVVQDNICFYTGTIATDSCPTRIAELFWQSQPPAPADQGFVQSIAIDSWTGLRANEWCNENVVTQTFANVGDAFAYQWLNNTAQGQRILQILSLPANLPPPPAGECQQGAPLPTVRINFPQENTQVLENVAITGQVSANDLNRWELQISEVGTDNFRSIMPAPNTSQVPVAGSTLFEWNSRTVQNGEYILRLAAFSNTNGGYIFDEVRIRVQNIPPTATPQPTQPPAVSTLPFDPLIPTATNDPFSGNGS
jgi:membrane peptidoglycan carboxypeptidase